MLLESSVFNKTVEDPTVSFPLKKTSFATPRPPLKTRQPVEKSVDCIVLTTLTTL
jgi:hypothetical protein